MIHQFFRGLYTCSLGTFFWAFKIFIAQFSCKGIFWMELFAPFLVVMRIDEKVDMTPLCCSHVSVSGILHEHAHFPPF